ncbi:guanine nucleotide-binding protein subunit alpha [Dinochytrium kinnereticum]|nr:guanine nucleotide-binding protein subunit alpha [Dinochytrium kinnereticum]
MGNCGSSEERAADERSKEIDNNLKADAKASVKSVKLLLLGPGDSGKSTLLKQFRLIHGHGFTDQERKTFRSVILGNLMGSMKTLITAMDLLQIPFGYMSSTAKEGDSNNNQITESAGSNTAADHQLPPSNPADSTPEAIKHAVNLIKNCPITYGEDNLVTRDIVDSIQLLWKEPGIQIAYSRRNEYQLYSACAYYMSNIERICGSGYVPTDQDILSARIITTSITETQIKVESMTFRIFDVGGQRSERKKWAPYFDDVKCIIFIADISAYDLTLVEENTVNRTMILFLNKIDLFQEKLQTVPLKNFFPDFKGANTFEEASEFFAERFSSLNQSDSKIIYVHFTWATDTTQIKKVLLTTNQIILQFVLITTVKINPNLDLIFKQQGSSDIFPSALGFRYKTTTRSLTEIRRGGCGGRRLSQTPELSHDSTNARNS